MNCDKAQELIDLRVHEPEARDWTELDAHLAQCAKCAASLDKLQRTRDLLAELRNDAPTSEEVQTMLGTLTLADGGGIVTARDSSGTWRLVARFTAACVGVAAVLVIAFGLGSLRYDRDSFVTGLLPTLSGERAGVGIAAQSASDTIEGKPILRGMAVSVAGDEATGVEDTEEGVEYLGRARRRVVMGTPSMDAPPSASRGVAGGTYITYGTSDKAGNALGQVQHDAGFDYSEYSNIRYGYQVPFGKRETAGAGVADDKVPWYEQLDYPDDWDAIVDAKRIMLGTEFVPVKTPPALSPSGDKDNDGTPGTVSVTKDSSFFDELRRATTVLRHSREMTTLNEVSPDSAKTKLECGVTVTGDSRSEDADEVFELLPDGEGVALPGFALAAAAQPQPARQVPTTPPGPVERRPEPAPGRPAPKIIKTGQVTVEVASYDAAVEQVNAIVARSDAFIADASTQEQAGGALVGKVVIRVAPARFEKLFAALKTLGRVESENAKAADVTEQYVDLEARIHSLQITEERLHELVKSKSIIDKVSSVLEVERELTRVRSQIEQLQGKLRVMADRIGRSTITLTIREPARKVPSASLSIEVALLQKSADALGMSLTELEGRLVSGKTSKHDNGTMRGTYQLEVSVARFAALLSALEDLGRVEDRQVKDHQFGDADEPWAQKVHCPVSLVLFERSRALPAGWVHLEVEELAPALKKLEELLPAAEAAIVANESTRQEDGSHVADVKLRVPAGRFATLLETLPIVGRTTSRNTSGEVGSIVGGAAHVPCTLALKLRERPREVPRGSITIEVETFETARTQLSALVGEKNLQVLGSASDQRTDGTWVGGFRLGIRAAGMEDVVTRLESLGRVEARRLSGLGLGDLSRMDPEALGVLELTLAEPAAIRPGPERAGDTVRGKLRDALAGLYTSLGYVIYGLIVIAPWLLIVLLLGWLLVRTRRRMRASK